MQLRLDEEREWGELILAAQGLLITRKLIERIPAERSDADLFLDTVGIVASYGQPFKRNKHGRRPGEAFLPFLNKRQRALHDKVMEMRDQDHAHSDFYDGRIRVKYEGADLWVRQPITVRPGETKEYPVEVSHRHRHTTSFRTLRRAELNELRDIAIQLFRRY